MPKINVYLPVALADAVKETQLPVSAICQAALERAVRDVTSARATEEPPVDDDRGLGVIGRFTPRARRVLTLAEDAARAVPHHHVGTEHLLLGVLDEGTNLALDVLRSLEIEPADLRAETFGSLEPPTTTTTIAGRIPFTPLTKQALEATAKEALTMGHNYIGCEHLLLGLLDTEKGLASRILRRVGLEARTTRHAVISALSALMRGEGTRPPVETSDASVSEILRRLDAIEKRLGA